MSSPNSFCDGLIITPPLSPESAAAMASANPQPPEETVTPSSRPGPSATILAPRPLTTVAPATPGLHATTSAPTPGPLDAILAPRPLTTVRPATPGLRATTPAPTPGPSPAILAPRPLTTLRPETPGSHAGPSEPSAMPSNSGRKRGRPPGSKNKKAEAPPEKPEDSEDSDDEREYGPVGPLPYIPDIVLAVSLEKDKEWDPFREQRREEVMQAAIADPSSRLRLPREEMDPQFLNNLTPPFINAHLPTETSPSPANVVGQTSVPPSPPESDNEDEEERGPSEDVIIRMSGDKNIYQRIHDYASKKRRPVSVRAVIGLVKRIIIRPLLESNINHLDFKGSYHIMDVSGAFIPTVIDQYTTQVDGRLSVYFMDMKDLKQYAGILEETMISGSDVVLYLSTTILPPPSENLEEKKNKKRRREDSDKGSDLPEGSAGACAV